MKKIFAVLIAIVVLCCVVIPVGAVTSAENALIFNDDGKFTILHITDPQDDHYPAYDMINFMQRAVAESKPDLIVLTGDIVEDSRAGDIGIDGESGREGVCVYERNGELNYEKTLENVKKAVDPIFSVFEEAGVPYVIAQGNNDHKSGISNIDWLNIYAQYPHCLTVDMSNDANDRIDYNVLINGTDGTPAFNLWLMDTGKGGVNEDQIEWYKKASADITAENGGNVIPSFVFQHINTADVGNMFEECKPWDEGATAKGTKFYRLNKEIASGKNFYAYTPCEPTAEFSAWKECGDVIGAFFGHQHVDGFSGTVDGIELGFTYGCEFAKIGPYGYRVFTLHEDDIYNYENDVYIYEGSVKTGTDKITLQVDNGYTEYKDPISKLFAGMVNFFKNMFTLITSLFG